MTRIDRPWRQVSEWKEEDYRVCIEMFREHGWHEFIAKRKIPSPLHCDVCNYYEFRHITRAEYLAMLLTR